MQSAKKISVEVKRTVGLDYLESLPDGCGAGGKKHPLVIFLHGAGERGCDLEKVKVHGIPKLIEEKSALLSGYEFVGVSPQCPEDMWWPLMGDEMDALIRYCIDELPVDTGRIYMTGLSMGGFGTWHFARRRPHLLAAIAPICGGTKADGELSAIKHIPAWVFHGAKDDVVALAESACAVAKLNELGANVKFTVYPEANHDSWTETYNNPAFYEWMFAQHNELFEF